MSASVSEARTVAKAVKKSCPAGKDGKRTMTGKLPELRRKLNLQHMRGDTFEVAVVALPRVGGASRRLHTGEYVIVI